MSSIRQWDELGLSPPSKDEQYKGPRKPRMFELLELVKQHVASVPYKPTARWVFYRVWQDGFYRIKPGETEGIAKKRANNTFNKTMSRFRYGGQLPMNVFMDDTRASIGQFWKDGGEYLEHVLANLDCRYDPWVDGFQDYVIVVFEARAMIQQFKHFCKPYNVQLWPLGGKSSISHQFNLAGKVHHSIKDYERAVKILYFGDCDKDGLIVAESAMRHIRSWIGKPEMFKAYHVGLTVEQAEHYNLPENPDKPGQYQWEALDHLQGGELIADALDKFCEKRLIEDKQTEINEWVEEKKQVITELLEDERNE